MFQTFTATTRPEQGPPRLADLRAEMKKAGLDGFLVPRADAHQGENVAPCDERLAWLTGFTGSAGFSAILNDVAGVFIDGRYTIQAREQIAKEFTPVSWPSTKLGPWLLEHLSNGARVGFDPWLHTANEIETLTKQVGESGIELVPTGNLVDAIWSDRPARPAGQAVGQPIDYAGIKSSDKRADIAAAIAADGQDAVVLTLPDSISWLLNIRGSDIARTPVVQAFAILNKDGTVSLIADPAKFTELGPDPAITIAPEGDFAEILKAQSGCVRVDKNSAPYAVSQILMDAGVEVAWGDDPCLLPKARKNPAEIMATRAAHLRDGVAIVEFLAWLDEEAPKGGLSEIDVVQTLESYRRDTNALRDISFETICGAGPNGAIVHYRVTEDSNRSIQPGELLLIDSGGQYVDGTTDITRTVSVGPATEDQRACFTRVLQGMIAISRTRFPRGLSGRDLDALARAPLWAAGHDYDHGTGHGVGAYLSVHEGPQRISKISEVALEPGMILSNEPGYYREGAFGIRIENLILVQQAPSIEGEDGRDQLSFETLTYAPIDRHLIDVGVLSPAEREWLNRYHLETLEKIGPHVSESARLWLINATQPI